MTRSPNRQAPAGYQLRVDGHLDHHWSDSFGDLTLTHESDGTTSLSGAVSDQAELHGLLVKIRDLGVTLISVEAIDPSGEAARIGPGAAMRHLAGSGESFHDNPPRQQPGLGGVAALIEVSGINAEPLREGRF